MDALLTLLGVAGVTYVMGVPGADDVMLSYQSTIASTTRSICAARSACARRRSSRPGWPAWGSTAGRRRGDARSELRRPDGLIGACVRASACASMDG